jgi:hypothetical protein
MSDSSDDALTRSAGLLPLELKTIRLELSEPTRSIYQAQLKVILLLDDPGMIESQSDLVLAHLDDAVAAAPDAMDKIARTGALLITHQLFLSYAFVVYQETGNRAKLEEAIEDFVSNLVTDICVSAAEAGKTFNPKYIIVSVLDAFKQRLAQDGAEFISRVIGFFFGRKRAAAARKAYLDVTFRMGGKAARRAYFRGNGQHLVDFLKRHESEIVELAVERSRFDSSDTSNILSSEQRAFIWIASLLPPILGVWFVVYLTGWGESFWGVIGLIIVGGITACVIGGLSISVGRLWLVRKITETRLHRMYRHLAGKRVSFGPT